MTNVSVANNGKFTNNVYSWEDNTNNLLEFLDLTSDGTTDLSEYDKIVIPVSNWSTGAIRCVIRVKTGDTSSDYTCVMSDYNSSSEPVEKKLSLLDGDFKDGSSNKITKDMLKKVMCVYFGGSTGGSAESKPSLTLGQVYLTKQLTWDDNGEVTILPQDFNCGVNVTRNGNSFTFNTKYSTLSIDFEGDGISARKLNDAKPNITDISIFYSTDNDHTHDKMSTSALNGANVIRIKYAYQEDGQKTVTIDNIKLTYNSTINVTLNANGGKINGVESKTIKYCDTPIKLPAATPSDQNSVFNAWRNGNSHCGNAGDDYTPTGTVTLTAHYTNKTLWGDNKDQLGDDTKTVPMNTVFTPRYTISNNTQREFTFTCNRPSSLDAFWYGWVMWAKPTGSGETVNSNPFYFWTNAQDTRYAEDNNTGIWTNSVSTDLKISKGGKLYDMTNDERVQFRTDMCNNAKVNVKVAYFDNTIRMYAVIKSSDKSRTYVQAYTYNNASYIKDANSIDVYFSVDHAYLTNFIAKDEINIIIVDGNIREYGIYVPEKVKDKQKVPVIFSLHGRQENGADPDKTDAPRFKDVADTHGVIIVYPQGRKAGDKQSNGSPYPNRTENGQDVNWDSGYAGVYGWEATGKENADTKFIQVLVKEIQTKYASQTSSNGNISVDPKRFYLCGFSMGGMMTYAIATALNDKKLFAAYASTGGFPVNQFHLNLATKMPVPFYHVHGKADVYVKYARLAEIRNNMLARYGCSLTPVEKVENAKYDDNTSYDHYTYRPKGKNLDNRTFADLEYVEVDGLGHSVHSQTPQGMWDFFKNYTTDIFNDYSDATTPEWQWDMDKINSDLNGDNHTEGHRVYGWSHYINNTANNKLPTRYLSYGEDKSTFVAEEKDGDGKDGNGNVYPAVQLKKGKHVLHVKADVAKNSSDEGYVSIKIINNSTGVEIVARKLVNNSGASSAKMTMVYSFETFDDAEFTIINSRSHDTGTKCTQLAIYREGYTTTDKDMSQDDFNTDITSGKVIEITFDNPAPKLTHLTKYDEKSPTISTGADKTNQSGDYAFYYANRLNHKDKNEDQKVIKNDDAVFGNYFQNMPHADVFERTAAQDYMRIVIPESKITELYNGVKASGQITIGFWVNAKLAVDRKLAYKDQSIFYLAGDTYGGPNSDDSKHLFGIKGDGSITGWMSNDVKYNTGGAFGAFCETSEDNRSRFYKNNFYLDGNWHYITFQMYDNLTRYNMYVDAFPAHKGGYATISNLEELKNLHSIVLGGLNANNVTYAYDVPFAYDDIVIYSRMLSHGDIKEIVAEKKYTPSWNFKQNLGNKNVFDASKLDKEWWDVNGNEYTLKKRLSTSANLTYNGIEVIPAFRGLQFATTAESGQIKINATDGTLYLASGVTIGFTNIPVGNSLRFETANQFGTTTDNGCIRTGNLNKIDNHIRTSFKKTVETGSISLTLGEMTTSWKEKYSGEVTIYSIERTNKSFMDLHYVSNGTRTTKYVYTGNGSETPSDLPSLKIMVNGTEANNSYPITYSSSAPQVAYVNAKGEVKITGVPGSAVITAELQNDGTYDTTYRDTNNPYTLFEDETRIFTTYEIVSNPSTNYQKISVGSIGTKYSVDQKLTT